MVVYLTIIQLGGKLAQHVWLLVSVLGAPLAVLVDAATYLYSAVTLSRMDVTESRPRAAGATHVWFVGNAIVGVVLAPYALNVLILTPFQLGLIGALGGVGALLGAAVTTRVGLVLGTGRTIIACHAISTGGVLVMVAAGEPSHAVGLGRGPRRRTGALRPGHGHEQLPRDELSPARHAR